MEFKEYIQILKKHFGLFLLVIILVVIAGIIFQVSKPANFKSSLTLNVTRTGSQQTSDYRYDDFYRLQADERFADTVVRWLGSPRIVTDIYNDAKITTAGLSSRKLSKIFKAQRLSSQLVQVTYITSNSRTSEKLSESIVSILNKQSDELNELQKNETWFKILGSYPVVKENKPDMELVIIVSILLGIFLGVWAVFIKNYFSN
ncbi:hypothetical protein BMS3Abin15_01139 [bacterium BMS3Abin15]|nr:hypothetical protein BMS3Abin15_01139 [bacterium BMS3Abin15]HDZ85200.1 hypothetical protein [Candidatus Moranbacteria bacterium]